MAFPTVTYNNITGSASAASGAGPATALTGTAASYALQVITLDGSPDLSGVDTTGLHVIYLQTTTGVRFFKITAVDDSADTVTVTGIVGGTATGLAWAIGGKRNSPFDTDDDGSTTSGLAAGWTVDIEYTGSTYSGTGLTWQKDGNTTDGPITYTSSSSTRPTLQSDSGANVDTINLDSADHIVISNLKVHNARGFGTGVSCVYSNHSGNASNLVIDNNEFSVGNCTTGVMIRTGRAPSDCRISNNHFNGAGSTATTIAAVDWGSAAGNDAIHSTLIFGNFFDRLTGNGISLKRNLSIVIAGNIFDGCANAIALDVESRSEAAKIIANTFYNPTADGISIAAGNNQLGLSILNNIFSGAGAYAVHSESEFPKIYSDGNCYYNSTSGVSPAGATGIVLGPNDITTDPGMTDPANQDFTLTTSASAKGAGVPGSWQGLTGNDGSPDIGAIQREESPTGVAYLSSRNRNLRM